MTTPSSTLDLCVHIILIVDAVLFFSFSLFFYPYIPSAQVTIMNEQLLKYIIMILIVGALLELVSTKHFDDI